MFTYISENVRLSAGAAGGKRLCKDGMKHTREG
jgi:hypothetical protein